MDLKPRVVLILLVALSLYGVLDYGIQRFIVFPKFEELERRQVGNDLQRSVQAFQGEVEHLESLSHDWSSWDDTYNFVSHPTDEYIGSNLTVSTFKGVAINLLYICDLRGRVIWGRIYDLETGSPIHDSYFPPDILPLDHPLFKLDFKRTNVSEVALYGAVVTEHGPMLVASRPILKTDNIGPVRGFLIMGKYLSKDLVSRLSRQTRVDFTIANVPAPAEDILKRTPYALESGLPYAIKYTNRARLDVLAEYPDITGKPAFLIRSTMERDIIRRGYAAMRYALVTLVIGGLALAVLILTIMERTVIHPIVRLTRHVLSIKETSNFSLRLSARRRDEIGTLAREFDHMLEKIEEMNTIMEHINDQLIEDINKRQHIEDKLSEANKQLQKLATIDGLTQISNRRRFDEYLQLEWKRGMRDGDPVSLIIIDVDFFKLYNDTYGHQAGDDCLKAVAGAISTHAKRIPDLAARYGGEEFAFVLPATDIRGAMKLAEVIRAHVRGLAIPHEKSIVDRYVTISAGVACMVPSREASFEALIKLADDALYDAKAKGRNRCVSLQEV